MSACGSRTVASWRSLHRLHAPIGHVNGDVAERPVDRPRRVGGAGGLPIFGQGEPICHPLVSCVHCRQECCPLLKPMQMMFDRAENEKSESDVAYFHGLMYAGEMMMKLAVAGLVAAVQDDRERNRYRLEYQLVRADSLGAWDKVLDNILAGPSAQFLDSEATTTTRALTERMAEGTWQASSLQGLSESIQRVGLGKPSLGTKKVQGRTWFKNFVNLRNGTRGHGAPPATALGEACPSLKESIVGVASHLPLFSIPWSYLHHNLSGKYRVTAWGDTSELLESLKRETIHTFADGVYIELGKLRHVAVVHSNPEGSDYWFANGGFGVIEYEMLSYLTNDRLGKPSTPYMKPAEELPASEPKVWVSLTPRDRHLRMHLNPSATMSQGHS